jgi:putative transposase
MFLDAEERARLPRPLRIQKRARRDVIGYREEIYDSRRRHSAIGFRRANNLGCCFQQTTLFA